MSSGFLPHARFPELVTTLQASGYRCLGPRSRDGAVVLDELAGPEDLEPGLHEYQAPGEYRLDHSAGQRYFAWANGPMALKPLTFAPEESLWSAQHSGQGLSFTEHVPEPPPTAVIGARACDLAALALQERHFLGGEGDARYGARRDGLLIVAVSCTHPADTCFCASTGDGPRVEHGFDLALAETDAGFVVDVGTEAGAAVAARLDLEALDGEQRAAADAEIEAAARVQHRALPSTDLRDPLFNRLGHPRWEQVAARCLACGNCTAVCPTCFCFTETSVPDLSGESSEQVRMWDSCFTEQHSYIHGTVVRGSIAERYRQWLTHKLAGWHDQFGRSGCVGCGRCITWCPTGIDLTEEVAALMEGEGDG